VEYLSGNKTANCIKVMVVQLDAALESKAHPVFFIVHSSFIDPAIPILHHPSSSHLPYCNNTNAHEGWRMEDGRWMMEDGRWTMDDGRWRMRDGGWRMEDGGWMMDDGRWMMDDGRWTMDDG